MDRSIVTCGHSSTEVVLLFGGGGHPTLVSEQRCGLTLYRSVWSGKIVMIVIPATNMATQNGKQPFRFSASHGGPMDLLLVTFTPNECITKGSLKTYEIIEDGLVVDRNEHGIVGLEFVGVSALVEM